MVEFGWPQPHLSSSFNYCFWDGNNSKQSHLIFSSIIFLIPYFSNFLEFISIVHINVDSLMAQILLLRIKIMGSQAQCWNSKFKIIYVNFHTSAVLVLHIYFNYSHRMVGPQPKIRLIAESTGVGSPNNGHLCKHESRKGRRFLPGVGHTLFICIQLLISHSQKKRKKKKTFAPSPLLHSSKAPHTYFSQEDAHWGHLAECMEVIIGLKIERLGQKFREYQTSLQSNNLSLWFQVFKI